MLSDRDIQSINLWISKMKQCEYKNRHQRLNDAERILQLKYKIIAKGGRRMVYDLENGYVLKVAITNWGLKSNETEFNIYTHCLPELQKYLCPVKSFGNGWIIMIKMDLKVPEKIFKEKKPQLKNEFLKVGIRTMDLTRFNTRLSEKGEIIVIDYGEFRQIRNPNIAKD